MCGRRARNHPKKVAGLIVQHGGQLVGCGAGQGRGRFGCGCEDAEPGFGPYSGLGAIARRAGAESGATIAGLRPKIPELQKVLRRRPENADAALGHQRYLEGRAGPGPANVIGSGAKLPPQRR